MKIGSGETLLFIGDSITDCGRGRPVGEGAGLGGGYVSLVDAILRSREPETIVRVLNTGISGNRVVDLRGRWEEDVISLQPNWLSILIGINDVWRQFDRQEWGEERQVSPELYSEVLGELVDRTVGLVNGITLMTPFLIEDNRTDSMRIRMDEYGRRVKLIAEQEKLSFVDLQAVFDRYLSSRPSQSLAADRIHPNLTGHCLIAEAFIGTL